MSSAARPSRPLRRPSPLAAAAGRLGALLVLGASSGVFLGCIDHLNNARVRGADEFECKRDEVQVTEVAEHVFVARGCGQTGAYRCETGIEGGCKKIQGKTGDKYIAMAPEAEPEEGDKPKKKKKKSAAEDGDESGEKPEKGEKKSKDEDADKPKKSESGDKADKAKKDEGSSSASASASKDDADADGEKKKKKKKKKSEDE